MRSNAGKLALFLVCLSLACAVPELLAKKKDKAADSGPNEQKRAVQALNRLTFGPRPGDIQQVMAMGVDRWIDLQLHPEKIPDSSEEFPDNQMIKQVMDGKKPIPSDPAKRAVFQVQIARLQEKQQPKSDRKEEAAASAPAAPPATDTAKTAEELAAAAAASPDATPSTSADNSMSAMNGEERANAPANEMSRASSADAKPAPVDDAEARRREDHLYADLKIQ